MFHLFKPFSLFPNQFRTNVENDQYHVSIDANMMSHHINVIIWVGLNEMLFCYHPALNYQLGLVDWREVCFAWLPHMLCYGSHVLCLFLGSQPLDRFLFLFFLFALAKMEMFFSWIRCFQTGLVRWQQTNNSLSPVFVINS